MIAAVVGSYVDSLTEREFDAPFMALLQFHGFRDIHFLHGPFEFGKDFIAKRDEDGIHYQYAFQTKAGDIGLSEWSQCRGQIDMLRTNALAHPNFDSDLARRAVFVTTGRLVGGATVAAQDYARHLRDSAEIQFKSWDRDTIVEMLAVDPRSLSGSTAALLQVLGAQGRNMNFSALEQHSRSWIRIDCTNTSLRDTLEAAVIANHCRNENRSDLACYTALLLLRSLWATSHGKTPSPHAMSVAITTARDLFRHYAMELWNAVSDHFLEPDEILRQDQAPAAFATYPVRCLTIVELLGMLGLLENESNPNLSAKIADYLCGFVGANVGAAHPISDRWGISLACCALLLWLHGRREVVRHYITAAVKWIADQYDDENEGLAGPYADVDEEIEYLLGTPFEHIKLVRRPESYTATQILDLCSVLQEGEMYDLARNEFLAVGICLPILEVDDAPAQYCVHSAGQRFESNTPYEEQWRPLHEWKVAPHHKRGPECHYPEAIGGPWNQIAISCAIRDRHFVKSWRRLVSSEQ
jgi:hypothetical protein